MIPGLKRGRPARVPGEPLRRVHVYVAESELLRLKAVARLNHTTVSEFLRDAGNDAAADCDAVIFWPSRRGGTPTIERR